MKEVTQKYRDMQKYWARMENVREVVNLFVGLSAASLAFLAGSKEIGTLAADPKSAIRTHVTSPSFTLITPLVESCNDA